MKKLIMLAMVFGLLLMGCESNSDKLRKKMELQKRSWEPSAWVKEWVEKEYLVGAPEVEKKHYSPEIEKIRKKIELEERLRKPRVEVKEETVLEFLRNTIEVGKNMENCKSRISIRLGDSVTFILLHQSETRGGSYKLWSVRILGIECYRIFTDGGVIERIEENPGLI